WRYCGREIRRADRRAVGLALLAGLFLALHFASWISSLSYTSVASSTALVTTNPIFVGIAGFVLFKQRLKRGVIIGIGLSIVGSIVIALSDQAGGGPDATLGDAMAL